MRAYSRFFCRRDRIPVLQLRDRDWGRDREREICSEIETHNSNEHHREDEEEIRAAVIETLRHQPPRPMHDPQPYQPTDPGHTYDPCPGNEPILIPREEMDDERGVPEREDDGCEHKPPSR